MKKRRPYATVTIDFLIRFALIALIAMFVIVPIYWTLVTSLKQESDIMRKGLYLPDPATLKNYIFAWIKADFSVYFKNTLIISGATALIVIVLTLFTAYALSRFRFRGRKAFMAALLITQLLPSTVLIIPLFLIFNGLGLIDTLFSLVISYTATMLPFNAVLMKSFVDGVPIALEEAGMIDGCSRFQVISKILFPLVMPGVVAVGAFAFLNSWNEFIFPIIFLFTKEKFVLSIGLSYMLGQNVTHYGGLAAGSIIALSVPILLFGFMQKHLIAGLSQGAVKG